MEISLVLHGQTEWLHLANDWPVIQLVVMIVQPVNFSMQRSRDWGCGRNLNHRWLEQMCKRLVDCPVNHFIRPVALIVWPVTLVNILQPRSLARTLKAWVTASENIVSDLFNCVRLSCDMWHLFSCKVNVNKSVKLWVDALGISLLDFKLTNTVGGQQMVGDLSELPIEGCKLREG